MQYRVSSKAAPDTFDIDALRKLTVDLGLPVFEKDAEYKKLGRSAEVSTLDSSKSAESGAGQQIRE